MYKISDVLVLLKLLPLKLTAKAGGKGMCCMGHHSGRGTAYILTSVLPKEHSTDLSNAIPHALDTPIVRGVIVWYLSHTWQFNDTRTAIYVPSSKQKE